MATRSGLPGGRGARQKNGSAVRHWPGSPSQKVDPQRHCAHELDPQQHRHAPHEVFEPGGAVHPPGRGSAAARTPWSRNTPMRQNEPTSTRPARVCCGAQQQRAEAAQALPLLRAPVEGLRIIERIGEARRRVMAAVSVPIALVGQPQRQRHDGEPAVEREPARRVTVHDLVLQRAVQRDAQRRERRHDPQRPVPIRESSASQPA